MQQEANNSDNAAIKAELLKTAQEQNPDLEPEMFGADLADTLAILDGDRVKEWVKLMEEYPVQKGKLYIIYPDSPNGNRRRGEEGSPSYKNLYSALDEYGINHDIHLSTLSVPLGIVPSDYYPICPAATCPGVNRWYVEKNDFKWDWKQYRDVINLVARALARFIHDQKAKRRHMIIVRKNSVEHDIIRTARNLLGYDLEVYPCPYPLWSEEATDYVTDVIRMAAEDIKHLDL